MAEVGFGLRVSWEVERSRALTTVVEQAGLQVGPGCPRLDMIRPYDFAVAGIMARRRDLEDMEADVRAGMDAIGPQTVAIPTNATLQRYRTYVSVLPVVPDERLTHAHGIVSGLAERSFLQPLTTSGPYELTLNGTSIDQASWRRSHRSGRPPVGPLTLGPCHTSVEAIPADLSRMRWLSSQIIMPL
jgi:hypothetical protein